MSQTLQQSGYDYEAAIAAMERRGWDIYRLCSEAKITPQTMWNWKRNGTTSRGTAASVACALGIDLATLTRPASIHAGSPSSPGPGRANVQHTTNGNGRRVPSASNPDTSTGGAA